MRALALMLALTSATLAPSTLPASTSDVRWCILLPNGMVTFCYPTLEQCTLRADLDAGERCIERPA